MAIQAAETLNSNSKGHQAEPNRLVSSALDKFFTLTLDMLFIMGFDGYFKQLNPVCEKILGYTSQEFLSQRWIEFIHPEDRPLMLKQLHQLLTNTGEVQFENRYRCKDGSYKWLIWNATSCQEQQLIYAIARDNTDCRKAEAARAQSEEYFRLLVEGVKDYALFMLDPNGCIVSWNSGAQRIKQYQASEIIGHYVSCFYPEADIEQGKPEQGLKIAALQGRFEEEGWRLRKDGSRFWANVVTTALHNEDGQLRGFARVTQDITERQLAADALQTAHVELEKRVEERTAKLTQINQLLKQEIAEHERTEAALLQSKARLKKQAQQLEAEKQHVTSLLQKLQRTQAQLVQTEKISSLGRVVAGVAHEINNPVSFVYCNLDYATCYIRDLMHLVELYEQHYPQPVAPIQNYMEAIDFDFLMVDLPKLLASMKVGANRIHQVVLSLQNFLKPEQAKKKPADIHEGIDSTLMILQHRLKATAEHQEIKILKEYGTLPLVDCYAGQLNQVFMHLLSNAIDVLEASIKDKDSSGCITISTGIEEMRQQVGGVSSSNKIPHAVIRVVDNGPGISEEICSRLFEPFVTTKPAGKGVGLGLSVSYQIVVEKHGGQLMCLSELGKGAEFLIAIPIQQDLSSDEETLSQCA